MTDDQEIKNGYVLLARVIQDSEIWRDDPHVLKLFVYLIMKARHKEEPEKYPHFKIRRGELVTYLAQIAEDNKYFNRTVKSWSRAKVSRMLNQLQDQGYIELLADTYGTHIKICKYETYQNTENYKRTLMKRKCNDSETIVRTNNKGNNEKNEKNIIPPTLEMVKKHCEEKGIDIDCEEFYHHHEARGWILSNGKKMKNWHSAIVTWKKNADKWGAKKKVAPKEDIEVPRDQSEKDWLLQQRTRWGFDFQEDGTHMEKWKEEADKEGMTLDEYGKRREENGPYTPDRPWPDHNSLEF